MQTTHPCFSKESACSCSEECPVEWECRQYSEALEYNPIYSNSTNPTVSTIPITRVFSRANHWTFEIPAIKSLIVKYAKDGKGWADPFAGESRFAEWRNDMNPERNQPYCMEAVEFAKHLQSLGVVLDGSTFDPPYSHRQVSEHYESRGLKATRYDTSANFTIRVKRAIAPLIKPGGYAISFGWNTSGFGKCLGFEIAEILIVSHGLTHNDTLVTVEKKMWNPTTPRSPPVSAP